ncbi:MAG: RNA polymerase factor sigma-54 [Helicobacteraceae bacterium]|jgi:RNA polymerase sigma-54 factor|nr:RNA polymerase factor sigma-54 [Helicobacteraceae bacterium]
MKLRSEANVKGRISATMRNWLPLLQCPITELEERLKNEAIDNPFLQITPSHEVSFDEHSHDEKNSVEEEDFLGFEDNYYRKSEPQKAISDMLEATTVQKHSLYDCLYEQITDHLFPTPQSKAIAFELIKYINDDGFFDGDTAAIGKKLNAPINTIESVRLRFEHLSPSGIGARDLDECFLFQLRDYDIDEELYQLVKTLILNRERLSDFYKENRFQEAMSIVKKFRNPPAIEFLEESTQIIPDIFVHNEEDLLEVRLNDAFYPKLEIEDLSHLASTRKEEFVRVKLKEARDLIDAVNMRKATLYKIGLMIVEYQYDFFKGNEIKPMKLADISEDLGRNSSTISRAISGKYLVCNRGIFPLKSFFSISIDDTSTRAIKDYMLKLIKNEPHNKPLSDQKLLQLIQNRFQITMVRRTITKYREQLNIATSGERKRLYMLC